MRVEAINPGIEVTANHVYLTPQNAPDLIESSHLVVDCLDNIQSRFIGVGRNHPGDNVDQSFECAFPLDRCADICRLPVFFRHSRQALTGGKGIHCLCIGKQSLVFFVSAVSFFPYPPRDRDQHARHAGKGKREPAVFQPCSGIRRSG